MTSQGSGCLFEYDRDAYTVQVVVRRSFADKAYTTDHRLEPDYLVRVTVLTA